jgi:RNA polymerase sigma-70 factor, ECF subfamily
LNEAEEILLARQGDESAWESLIYKHQEAVFRYAYLLLGDSILAEDAAQETFISAYKSLDRFDNARPIRPWLLKIAANKARNQKRSVARYLASLNRLFHVSQIAIEDIEKQVLQNVEEEALWQIIRRMSLNDQRVIYLRYFLNLPVADTASALGIAEGTVKSRLSRALSRLKNQIDKQYPPLKEGYDSGQRIDD